MLGLSALNVLPAPEARAAFLGCCSVGRWADEMVAARPFADEATLRDVADAKWRAMGPADWREAFAGHARIGDWSEREQAAAARSSDTAKAELARITAEYEVRFGHIFLVCASGRSAAELLADARARMKNDPETELRVASEEQGKITQLRLARLLEEVRT